MSTFIEATLKKILVQIDSPQSWPSKQNGTTVVAAVMILEVLDNWRSVLQINILKENLKLWILITFCLVDRNSGEKTSLIEWLFQPNLRSRSFGYFECSPALWLHLDPRCKGNSPTRVDWVCQVQIVTWPPN